MNLITPNILLAFVLVIPITYILVRWYKSRVDKMVHQTTSYQQNKETEIELVSSAIPPIKFIDKLKIPRKFIHYRISLPYLISGFILSVLLYLLTSCYFDQRPFNPILSLLISFYIFSPIILFFNFYYSFSATQTKRVRWMSLTLFLVVSFYLIMRNLDLPGGPLNGILALLYMYSSIPILYWILTKISKTKELIFISYPISIIVASLFAGAVGLLTETKNLQSIFEPIYRMLEFIGQQNRTGLTINILGLGLGLTITYLLALLIRNLFIIKKINNLIIMMDGIWLLQMSWILSGYNENYPVALYIILLFTIYKLLVHIFYQALNSKRPKQNTRLLVLRVFALANKSFNFFDKLKRYWANKGSIQLIAGYDLTNAILDIDDVLHFMSGSMRNRFNLDDAHIKRNLEKLDFEPDVDYRYRVNEMYCTNSTWQTVLNALISKTDYVIMDIRQFSRINRGSAHEIKVLMQSIPLTKILFIVNNETDIDFFKTLVMESFAQLPNTSPNVDTPYSVQLLNYMSDKDFDYLIDHFEKLPSTP